MQEAQFGYVSVALLGSLLTLVSMSKIYVYVFWGEEKPKRARAVRHLDLLLPAAFLVLITVSLGLMGEPVFSAGATSGDAAFSREIYIQRSLPPRRSQSMAGLLLLNLILALTWAALQGELNAANLVIGFLVSAALIYLFRRMFFRPLYFRKVVLG